MKENEKGRVELRAFIASLLVEVAGWLYALATLPLEKELQYPLDKRLGGPSKDKSM
jgi:hypothetical protein